MPPDPKENSEDFTVKNDDITDDNKCANNENISSTKTIPLLILPSSVADSSNTNTTIIDSTPAITDNSDSILAGNDISDKKDIKKKILIKNSNTSRNKLTEESIINGIDNSHQQQVEIEIKETDLSESSNENDKSLLSALPMIEKNTPQQKQTTKLQNSSTTLKNSEPNLVEMKIEKMDIENHSTNFASTNDTTIIDSMSDLSLNDPNTISTNNGNEL